MSHEDRDDGEIGILDFVVFVMEHWRWFMAAALIAGLLATLYLKSTSSPIFVSEAVIRMTAIDAARIKSEAVLKPALLRSAYLDEFTGSIPDAIHQLSNKDFRIMSAGRASNVGRSLYRLSVAYKTADGSRDLLAKIIDSFIDSSRPRGEKRKSIELRIKELKRIITDIEPGAMLVGHPNGESFDAPLPSKRPLDDVNFYLETITHSLARRYYELTELHEDLVGSVSKADVIQDVTPATGPRAVSQAMLIIAAMVMAIMAVAAALLLRRSFQKAMNDERKLRKIDKIRRTLGLQPLSQR
jgi:hypothetical protein